jgi:thioesterase domain-containing protein
LKAMMRTKPVAVVLAAVLLVTCLGKTSQAQTAVHGRAYLFYGLVALIDWGMDQLAARINRAGVLATTNGHMTWRAVADQAITDYRRDPKPISVVGHSAGGDSAVEFAEALAAARVPVALLITYDPNRTAHAIPANVERYIDLYQSSNVLGGGDIPPGRGFHGHYAAFNLKDRPEIVHVNMDKFEGIQAQLAAKIRSAGVRGEGEAVPLHIVFASTGPIELWDSGMPVQARAGDTIQTIAAAYHVPAWAVAQINQKSETASLGEGQRVVVPRFLGQHFTRPPAGEAKSSPTEAPKPAVNESPADAVTPAPTPALASPMPSAAPAAPAAAPTPAASEAIGH